MSALGAEHLRTNEAVLENQVLTLTEALRLGAERLKRAGIETAALDMSLLLAHALGMTRLEVYTQGERPLNERERGSARDLLARRLKREPLAYIVGHREFFGLKLKVTPAVLIPRPETEVLVEDVLEWLVSRACAGELRVADIGTGSGAIAIAIAKKMPDARVVATDISQDALEVARENAATHGCAEQISFVCGSLYEALVGEDLFDAILSNPPYIAEGEREQLMPEVAKHEPAGALFSGKDGLDHLRRLIKEGPKYLKPGGILMVECGEGQAQTLLTEIINSGEWCEGRAIKDLAGIERVVAAQVRGGQQD